VSALGALRRLGVCRARGVAHASRAAGSGRVSQMTARGAHDHFRPNDSRRHRQPQSAACLVAKSWPGSCMPAKGKRKGRAPWRSTTRQGRPLELHTVGELAALFEGARRTVYRVLERARAAAASTSVA